MIFTALANNVSNGTVTYIFKVNGVSVQNTSSNNYTTSTLANGDAVSCAITVVGGTCVTSTIATSNSITVNISANVTAFVSIATITNGPLCLGTLTTFTATAFNIGNGTVTFNFKVNGISVQNSLFNILNTTTLINGDIITCDVSINGGLCLTSNFASSNSITIVVLPSITASITIIASSTNICAGTNVTFTASSINGGTNSFYQWKINGIDVGTNTTSFTTTNLNNNDIVSCTLTSNAACVTNIISFSNHISITVNAASNPSLNVIASNNNICSKTNITFIATGQNIGGLSIYQWQLNGNNVGTNSSTYFNNNLLNGDVVTCILNTNNICTLSPIILNSSVFMMVKPEPVISFNPAVPTILIGNSIVLNATVSVNVTTYLWSGSTGLSNTSIPNPIANPTQTTTYNLKVTSTDNCVADSNVTVKVLTNIFIPNSFTPNADNINDVFRIPPTAALKNLQYFIIFNRYCNKVFETKDINKGWDGTYKGTKAGFGVYIYTIKAFNNKGEVILKGTVLLLK